MTLARLILAVCLILVPVWAQAAATAWVGDARGSARLITAIDATGSGTRLDAAIELRLAPGWHTYWRTPGDAGLATTADWSGSRNLSKAEIAWPAPRRLSIDRLENNVYLDRVVLPVTLTLTRPGEPLRLHAEVDYASCNQVCIPYHASLDLALPAGLALPGAEAPLIAAAAAKVPGPLASAGLRLLSATVSGVGQDAPSLAVALASDAGPFRTPDLFVEGVPQATPRPLVAVQSGRRAVTLVTAIPGTTAKVVDGRPLTFTVVDGARSAEFTATPAVGAAPSAGSDGFGALSAMLAVALLGGLILNAMPCVLPVLSLKLLAVASYAGGERRGVRLGLLATAAGVVASFLAIAAVLAGLKLAGAAVGWGIQFQQPWFLAGMAAVTTLFAASLWGLLPVDLPGLAGGAANLRSRHAMVDAFLAGAFATVMATSCSAPFVGTAVGFALARGSGEIVLVFAALGLGMAAPLLAVAAAPGFVRLLPRPGPWMDWLRRALGVALAGTAIWLIWVLVQVSGPIASTITAAALAGIVGMLALRARSIRPGRRIATKRVATIATLTLVAAAVLVPSLASPPAPPVVSSAGQAVPWRPFDAAAIRREVADGRLVFVDVTAAWCLTCKVNEAAVLDRAPVADWLRSLGTVAMRADWTRPEPRVTAYLQSFGRYGVPLDVVYGPGRPEGVPLPELLSATAVLDAMTQAAGPAGPVAAKQVER